MPLHTPQTVTQENEEVIFDYELRVKQHESHLNQ